MARTAPDGSCYVVTDPAAPINVSGVATEAKQDALNTLVGEVQATPTANTVLSRLKTIADNFASLATNTMLAAVRDRLPAAIGQNTKAGSLSITVASDQGSLAVSGPLTNTELRATAVPISGSVTVSDGSGPLTVDGTVAATQSGNWTARQLDGAGNAITSRAAGAARAQDMAIVDGSGNQITSFPIAGLAIPTHDYVSLSYTSGNLTGVVYKTGGSGGTTVATLTLAYSNGILSTVTKS